MSLLRILTYCLGGIMFTMLWIASSFSSLSSNEQREISGVEMLLVPLIGWFVLVAIDRGIHSSLFGIRNVLRLNAYRPCPVCPITGQEGEESRNLVFSAHAIGPVHVTMKYRLPILISRAAAVEFPNQDIEKLPGMMIARYTKEKVTIYIKDRGYQMHFATANQAAMV
jgi:hypothetical protein